MNRLEKSIYDLVKRNPRLKTMLRNKYQELFDLFPKTTRLHSSLDLEVRKGYFFGFHDHSPFSYHGGYLLANKHSNKFFMPVLGDELEVGVFTGEGWKQYEPITTTRAWNWHMGCRLQWVGTRNCFFFNDFSEGEIRARLFDLDSLNDRWFDYPISSVSANGAYFLSYDFSDVESLMPGYGYKSKDQSYFVSRTHSALTIVSCKNGTSRNLIEPGQLLDFGKKSWKADSYHFLSHTQISPCSQLIAFLHRWIDDGTDIRKRHSRLLICNIDGKMIAELPTNGMVSHFCWVSSSKILAFCSSDELGSCYHMFEITDQSTIVVSQFSDLKVDGHPSYNSFIDAVVTDTYPNRSRMQNLFVLDLDKGKPEKVASFYMPKDFQSPSAFSHWSVDLHPRWSRDGAYICVDSAFCGVRSMVTLKVNAK